MGNVLAKSGSFSKMKLFLPVMGDLKLHLVSIESSFTSLVKQISELAKRLESLVLASSLENCYV
ncbi:hypothetical protein G9A89_014603 [Geosiphon pyriformis]|nr:hypothetical protein G9A89_014603 [Geosiphon pyriformis]